MGTLSSEINDLFMMQVTDYKLTNLYNESESDFDTYLEAWLLLAIDDFDICTQDLSFIPSDNFTTGYFVETLTQKNKNILSQLMVKYWLMKEIQDVVQMNLYLQDHDFKTHSAAQNLRAKQDYLNSKKEELSQLLVDYGYKNNDWEDWKLQDFD